MNALTRHLPAALLVAALSACGGSPQGGDPQTVNVGVEPPSAELPARGVVQFAATVTGTADTTVAWEVVESGGGTVDASGRYSAPTTPGVFHVRATSRAVPGVSGQGTVTVVAPPPPVAVAVSPRTASVAAGGTVAFTATVTNAADTSVTWSVPGAGCGTITTAGVYTAPAVAATCTVVATSRADGARSDTATVTVTAAPPPVAVSVTPSPAAGDACTTIAFTASVTGATDRSVTWSVQEGAAGGTISTAGVYTLPPDAGTWHVVATSNADPSRSAVVPVAVADRILAVAVSPQNVQLAPGGTAQFTATVTTTCGTSTSTGTVVAPAALVAK